jgi:hypothetical protein
VDTRVSNNLIINGKTLGGPTRYVVLTTYNWSFFEWISDLRDWFTNDGPQIFILNHGFSNTFKIDIWDSLPNRLSRYGLCGSKQNSFWRCQKSSVPIIFVQKVAFSKFDSPKKQKNRRKRRFLSLQILCDFKLNFILQIRDTLKIHFEYFRHTKTKIMVVNV